MHHERDLTHINQWESKQETEHPFIHSPKRNSISQRSPTHKCQNRFFRSIRTQIFTRYVDKWTALMCSLYHTYHDIELLRLWNQLHAAVVHNNLIVLYSRILCCNFPTWFQEKTICQLHNVCFVHCCYFLSIIEVSILECILSNTLGTELCYHLGRQLNKKLKKNKQKNKKG